MALMALLPLYILGPMTLGSWAEHNGSCTNATFPTKLSGYQFFGMQGGEEVSGPDECRAKCCDAGYVGVQ